MTKGFTDMFECKCGCHVFLKEKRYWMVEKKEKLVSVGLFTLHYNVTLKLKIK